MNAPFNRQGSEQSEIDAALAVLRSGTRSEKIAARGRLARIFERRDQLDYAAECLEANVLDGVRDPLLYERLASIYDRQGEPDRADQARAEARTLIERGATAAAAPPAAPSIRVPTAPPTTRRLPATTPLRDYPLAALGSAMLRLSPRMVIAGAGVFLLLGAVLLISAAVVGTPTASSPAPQTPDVTHLGEPTPETAHVDPTLSALIGQIANIQATAAATQANVQPPPTVPPPPIGSDAARAVDELRAIAAFVLTETGTGSGVSLGGGRFVTNYHVVEDAATVAIRLPDGRTSRADVQSVDSSRDLALLSTSLTDVRAANFRDSRELRPAENLYVVGYPRGSSLGVEEVTVTRGIFSARRQSRNDVWHVQTDAPMNPGNSGGPVGDDDGKVVGLATWGLRDSDGLNFAVASLCGRQ